jgi:AP2-like factor (euAP2 lineage)
MKKEKVKPWTYILVSPNLKVKIDKEDLERVSEHKWRVTYGTSGRMRVVTTVRTPDGARHLTLGRFLMSPPKSKQVYPRRFNEGLDYRKSNLVICTMKERQRLLPKSRKAASSEYRGVSYSSRYQKWKAAIKINGKSITIGFFDSEDEAARQYNKVALQKFGDIAYQNRVGKNNKNRND